MTDNISDKTNGWFSTAIEGIKTSASNGVSFFKKSWVILTLVTALIGAAGYVIYLNHKNEKIAEDLAVQEQKTEELKAKTEEVIAINQQNQQVLQQLKDDRERTDRLVESFNEQINLNSKVLSVIGTKVSTLQDGQVAPVLRETVRELQQLREKRK
jgi:Tfp pilus assembly protein PilO